MNPLGIDARQMIAKAAIEHDVGTLLLCPTQTTGNPGPFWGVRFDGITKDGVKARNIIWFNGMPWHGTDPLFYAMNLDGHAWGDALVIGCGEARIEIDPMSGVGSARNEMRWDRTGGHIASTPRGVFLIGTKSERSPMWGGYWAVDLATWHDVDDAHNDQVADWFSRWQVVVETPRGPFVRQFDARGKSAAKAA